MRKKLLLLALIIFSLKLSAQLTINIEADFNYGSILEYTIQDIKKILIETNQNITKKKTIEVFCSLDENLSDSIYLDYKNNILKITASSEKSMADGIYYFLQDKLNILFYHPKETGYFNVNINLTAFNTSIYPKFKIRGYHMHTTHPIELSDYILDHTYGEKGIEEVKHYIDWLARNGQNYFEFVLLESVKLKKWIPYFKTIEEYAHQRGIVLGLNVTLHHIQQKVFTLYKNWPNSWKSKKKQILKNIETLNQLKWDYWVIDFKTHEFSKDNSDKITRYKKLIFDELTKRNVKFADKYHVVNKPDPLANPDTSLLSFISKTTGLIHTVMFYSLVDEKAPVYEVENFQHSISKLLNSKKYRETWYYPESAYWVTFDNSVPLMLTPYLNARIDDINFVDSIGVAGHSTFTSGWEWGYWLFDWSIANWTWNKNKPQNKYDFVEKITNNNELTEQFSLLADLQNTFIKDSNLIQYMDAQAATDELPTWIFNKEFHPRPKYSYKYIRNKATPGELNEVKQDINTMTNFVNQSNNILEKIDTNNLNLPSKELFYGYCITVLRAQHKIHTLNYLIHKNQKSDKETLKAILNKAKKVREEAQLIVRKQEENYRYPYDIIAVKRKNKTAYRYGYLYTVSDLYFWEREELQAKKNKYNAWYKKINSFLRISGVIN